MNVHGEGSPDTNSQATPAQLDARGGDVFGSDESLGSASPYPPAEGAAFSRTNAAFRPTSRNRAPSTLPNSSMSEATSPVQPVWWLAPMPAPLLPWKYS